MRATRGRGRGAGVRRAGAGNGCRRCRRTNHAEVCRLLASLPAIADDMSGLSAHERAFLERIRLRVACGEFPTEVEEIELIEIVQGWRDE